MTLVSTTTTGPQIRTYSYDTTSNRLTGLSNPALAYSYDAVGNTTADGTFGYAYSGRNRLVEVKQGSSTVATYEYNALGQRVAKTVGTTTLFAYDEAGHLLGEYDGTGAMSQETVWLNDTPVATLRKAGTSTAIHYVWADHLDTPRAITTSDAAATLEWSWDSDPFGTTAPQEIALTYNLRFPGQYFDVETGKHYNYFRDYDPGVGRYVESDPIGLKGGANTYGYAGQTPLPHSDFSVVDLPALPTQQHVHPPIAVAPLGQGDLADALAQPFGLLPPRLISEQRARDPYQPTGAGHTHLALGHQDADRLAPCLRAHHFRPRRSLRAALSSAASPSSRLSFAFSASSSFSRLASGTCIPPYLAFQL